jgi:hypothetical protein
VKEKKWMLMLGENEQLLKAAKKMFVRRKNKARSFNAAYAASNRLLSSCTSTHLT